MTGSSLFCCGQLGEVAAILFERFVGGLRIGAGDTLIASDLGESLQKIRTPDSQILEDLPDACGGRLLEHCQHQVLDGDIFVLEFPGFVLGLDQQLVQTLGHIDAPSGRVAAGDAGDVRQLFFELRPQEIGRKTSFFEESRDQASFLFHQGKEEVLHICRLVLPPDRNILGLHQGGLGVLGKFVQVHITMFLGKSCRAIRHGRMDAIPSPAERFGFYPPSKPFL